MHILRKSNHLSRSNRPCYVNLLNLIFQMYQSLLFFQAYNLDALDAGNRVAVRGEIMAIRGEIGVQRAVFILRGQRRHRRGIPG